MGGNGGCRVNEVRAGTTSPMPHHKGFKLQQLVNFQKFSTFRVLTCLVEYPGDEMIDFRNGYCRRIPVYPSKLFPGQWLLLSWPFPFVIQKSFATITFNSSSNRRSQGAKRKLPKQKLLVKEVGKLLPHRHSNTPSRLSMRSV